MLKVIVNNANNGGLLSAIDGLPAFLPFSLVSKRVGKSFITLEDILLCLCMHHVGLFHSEAGWASFAT